MGGAGPALLGAGVRGDIAALNISRFQKFTFGGLQNLLFRPCKKDGP